MRREPRRYTPKHLAEKILTSRAALEGERKQVTVLFADVRGSMDLADQVDPEAWHGIMDRFLTILAEGVHRFEGTVNQYTGDGIMALFGAPIAHEDHAQRACWAALHLADALRGYAQELKREQGLGFSVRMGLNSGEVIVGRIGDDLRMDYTAQGQVVGLAARMEQLASPDTIYLTERTAALVSGYFDLQDLGHFHVKGVREPTGVHQLRGVGRLRTRLEISRARGLSRFIGRTDEMATLEAALDRAVSGQGQVVGVVAHAGTGKRGLCFEFAERCRARGIAVYEAHAVAHGKAIPLLPVLELWRCYFGITERDGDRAARDKIAGRMVLLDPQLADALPLMFDFLGVPDPERPGPRIEAEARQRQIADVVRRLVRARSQREQAGVLVLEDLHWLDAASEGFVETLVESAPGGRALLLLNFRPEYRAPWMQKSWYHQLPLEPLGPEATEQLLTELLGSDPSVQGLAALIRERTGGNPFFIEEVVHALLDQGALARPAGVPVLTRPVAEIHIPATVQAVLAARIDRLPERVKQVLQTAAVIGKTFAEPVLRRVVADGEPALSPPELKAALRSLTQAEFLYEEALYPEVEYAFKHPLTQEVAYGSQLGARRRRIHAAVARAVEDLDPRKLDERAALLAQQARDAVGNLTQALLIAREKGALLIFEAQYLGWLARAHLGLGDWAAARATGEEAIDVAARRGTRLYEMEPHLVLARVLIRTGAADGRGDIESKLAAAWHLAEETGAKGYLPFIRLERAELARLTGDGAARQRELDEAHRLFTAMGATAHAAEVERLVENAEGEVAL
jgi:class 3 adenylate cyclase